MEIIETDAVGHWWLRARAMDEDNLEELKWVMPWWDGFEVTW